MDLIMQTLIPKNFGRQHPIHCTIYIASIILSVFYIRAYYMRRKENKIYEDLALYSGIIAPLVIETAFNENGISVYRRHSALSYRNPDLVIKDEDIKKVKEILEKDYELKIIFIVSVEKRKKL